MSYGDTARHGWWIHGNERHTVDEIDRSQHHTRIGFLERAISARSRVLLHVGTPCVLRMVVKILLSRAISEALAPVLAERDAGDNTRRQTFPFLFCPHGPPPADAILRVRPRALWMLWDGGPEPHTAGLQR